MHKKYGSLSSELLKAIGEGTGLFSWPLEGTRDWAWEQLKNRKRVYDNLYHLKNQGFVRQISKSGKNFFELTKKGQLKLLLSKTKVTKSRQWDGKWRLVIFDIPEDAKVLRNKLRELLKEHGFTKLQASVFISPYPLNREGIRYLKESGLIEFIRMLRVDEIDFDKDLKKKYHLK